MLKIALGVAIGMFIFTIISFGLVIIFYEKLMNWFMKRLSKTTNDFEKGIF